MSPKCSRPASRKSESEGGNVEEMKVEAEETTVGEIPDVVTMDVVTTAVGTTVEGITAVATLVEGITVGEMIRDEVMSEKTKSGTPSLEGVRLRSKCGSIFPKPIRQAISIRTDKSRSMNGFNGKAVHSVRSFDVSMKTGTVFCRHAKSSIPSQWRLLLPARLLPQLRPVRGGVRRHDHPVESRDVHPGTRRLRVQRLLPAVMAPWTKATPRSNGHGMSSD